MKRYLITTLLSFLCLTPIISVGQIQSSAGAFEKFTPWGDGFLGVSYKQAYAVIPKNRTLELFTKDGNSLWETKISPFNFVNTIVVHPDAEYAYLINQPFTKSAVIERKSSETFLNVHRIDKRGQETKKEIKFNESFSFLRGEQELEVLYIAPNKDGIVLVTTSPKNEGKFHLITISSNFETASAELSEEWNESDWEKNALSKPNFVLNGNELSVIQLKRTDNKIEFNVETFQLDDITQSRSITNVIEMDGFYLGTNKANCAISVYGENYVEYFAKYFDGGRDVTEYKLGSLINYQTVDNEIYAIATTYKNAKQASCFNPNGFCYFKLDTKKDQTWGTENIKFQKFSDYSDEKYPVVVHSSVILTENGPTYVLENMKKVYYSVEGSEEQLLNVKKYMFQPINGLPQVLELTEPAKKVEDVLSVYRTENGIIAIQAATGGDGVGGYKSINILKGN